MDLYCLHSSHLEREYLSALPSRFAGPPSAAGLPNQLQWGALPRLSPSGRNCTVIEPRDNNTLLSDFLPAVYHHQHYHHCAIASATPASTPDAQLDLLFHFTLFRSCQLFYSCFTFHSCSVPATLSPTILLISVPSQWAPWLRGTQKLQCRKTQCVFELVDREGKIVRVGCVSVITYATFALYIRNSFFTVS